MSESFRDFFGGCGFNIPGLGSPEQAYFLGGDIDPFDGVPSSISSIDGPLSYDGEPEPPAGYRMSTESSSSSDSETRLTPNPSSAQDVDPNSSPFIAPPSAQPSKTYGLDGVVDDEALVDLDEFDLEGFTQEEIRTYNSMAEPGQRLQDAVNPKKMRSLMQNLFSGQNYTSVNPTVPTAVPSVSKQVVSFARNHHFLWNVHGPFLKSERRQFERDIYDFAEALGLDHSSAKRQVIKARAFCGEDAYDSDNSALTQEIDDSEEILKRLKLKTRPNAVILPSIEDASTSQAKPPNKDKPSPKKSPYFAAPKKSEHSTKKKKVVEDGLQEPKANGNSDLVNGTDEVEKSRKAAKKARRAKERAVRAENKSGQHEPTSLGSSKSQMHTALNRDVGDPSIPGHLDQRENGKIPENASEQSRTLEGGVEPMENTKRKKGKGKKRRGASDGAEEVSKSVKKQKGDNGVVF